MRIDVEAVDQILDWTDALTEQLIKLTPSTEVQSMIDDAGSAASAALRNLANLVLKATMALCDPNDELVLEFPEHTHNPEMVIIGNWTPWLKRYCYENQILFE
jgi:hypothetical protein